MNEVCVSRANLLLQELASVIYLGPNKKRLFWSFEKKASVSLVVQLCLPVLASRLCTVSEIPTKTVVLCVDALVGSMMATGSWWEFTAQWYTHCVIPDLRCMAITSPLEQASTKGLGLDLEGS